MYPRQTITQINIFEAQRKGIYYGITISIVSTATGMTVFTLNIHHKGYRGRKVPSAIKKICHNFFAKILCMRLENFEYNPSRVVSKVEV
jgi:hypothetical protein